jgi:transcriptional regulator with XRE-family HTH domain
MKHPFWSEAAKRLGAAMARDGKGRTEAASMLGVDISVLRRWLNGQRMPDIRSAARIEDVFGVPARLWAKPASTPRTAA